MKDAEIIGLAIVHLQQATKLLSDVLERMVEETEPPKLTDDGKPETLGIHVSDTIKGKDRLK